MEASGGLEWIANVAGVLASPAGVMILMVGIGYTGFRGIWVWKREIDRERTENVFLRGLVNQLAGVQEKQAVNLDRAVTVAEIRAQIRSDGGEAP